MPLGYSAADCSIALLEDYSVDETETLSPAHSDVKVVLWPSLLLSLESSFTVAAQPHWQH